MNNFDISTISKAIGGGVAAAIIGVLARYGFHPTGQTVTALGVVVTALVSYAVGHVMVYIFPANKLKF